MVPAIQSYERTRSSKKGLVVKTKRYLLTLEGLPTARVNDIIDPDGNMAIVRSLSDEYVRAPSQGEAAIGDRYQFYQENMYSFGDHLFGRVINTLGVPIDGQGSFPPKNTSFAIELEAPGIEVRQDIHEQLHTGVSVVDTLVPIAKGQRQMLFGPTRSGKTTFLTQTVQAQTPAGPCVSTRSSVSRSTAKKITDTTTRQTAPRRSSFCSV